MSTNRTLLVLALGLALAACSNGEKAQDAARAAPAATPTAVGTPAPAAAPAAASAPFAAIAANAAAATATDAAAPASNSAAMATNATIQSQAMNMPDFAADLIEAKRSDNVLSIKVRVKNAGAKAGSVHFAYGHKIEEFYVQAENKKYFVLRDTEKVPVADGVEYTSVEPGASYTWWAKYPAPPATVKKFNFYWPLTAPFDDVPITDK
jgi:hypothetical protein